MNSHITLDDLLDSKSVRDAQSIINNNNLPFSELVDLLNLNKSTDFQQADLCGVDFSNSDLRGFNFSGSNLESSYGHSIVFDKTTIFDNADIEPSYFSFEIKRRVFEDNSDFNDDLHKLKSCDWTGISIWAHDLKDNHVSEYEAMLAKQLLTEEISPTAKKDIAYNARKYFNSYSEVAEFIYFCTASKDFRDSGGKFDFITGIGDVYINNIEVYNAFFNVRYSGSFSVQEKILNILISSNINKEKNRIFLFKEFNSSKGEPLRKYISEHMWRSLYKKDKYIFEDSSGSVTSDPMSLDKGENINNAINILNKKFKINTNIGKKFGINTKLTESAILQKVNEVINQRDLIIFKNNLLRNLMKVGLPERALEQNRLNRLKKERLDRAISDGYRKSNRNY